MAEVMVGTVTDFFSRPEVAGIDLIDTLKKGERIHIMGHTTDIELPVESLQIDHRDVIVALPGQSVGVKVPERVRKGDHVYRLV